MAQVTRGAPPEGLAVRGMPGWSVLFLLQNHRVQRRGQCCFWLRVAEVSCWVIKFSSCCKAKQHFPPLGSSHRFPECLCLGPTPGNTHPQPYHATIETPGLSGSDDRTRFAQCCRPAACGPSFLFRVARGGDLQEVVSLDRHEERAQEEWKLCLGVVYLLNASLSLLYFLVPATSILQSRPPSKVT